MNDEQPTVPSDEEQGLSQTDGEEVTYVVRLFTSEFEWMDVAAATGPGAWEETSHYAGQYVDEGIRVDVIKRTEEVMFSLERGSLQ